MLAKKKNKIKKKNTYIHTHTHTHLVYNLTHNSIEYVFFLIILFFSSCHSIPQIVFFFFCVLFVFFFQSLSFYLWFYFLYYCTFVFDIMHAVLMLQQRKKKKCNFSVCITFIFFVFFLLFMCEKVLFYGIHTHTLTQVHTHTQKKKKKKKKKKTKDELPIFMECPRIIVDPTVDARYFIFGDKYDARCWEYDCISQTSKVLRDWIPISKNRDTLVHKCAYFQLKNDSNETSTYVLLYGGSICYHIYDFQTKTWNPNNPCMLGMLNFKEEREIVFGWDIHMTTDLCNKNTIHIVHKNGTYGYMQFDHATLNDPKSGFYYFFLFD